MSSSTLRTLIAATAAFGVASLLVAGVEAANGSVTTAQGSDRGKLAPADFGELLYRGLPMGEVKLSGGIWKGGAESAGTQPERVELSPVAPVRGDLDGDRKSESVVILMELMGEVERATDLAVVAVRGEQYENVATERFGDQVALRDVTIADGKLIVDLLSKREDGAAGSPPQKERRWYRLKDGALALEQTFDMGTLAGGDLEGVVWELVSMPGETLGAVRPTVRFLGERIVGSTGCNAYGAGVTTDKPGTLVIDSPRVTRRPCRDTDAAAAEPIFLERLRGVSTYTWSAGRLVFSYQTAGGASGKLYFVPKR